MSKGKRTTKVKSRQAKSEPRRADKWTIANTIVNALRLLWEILSKR